MQISGGKITCVPGGDKLLPFSSPASSSLRTNPGAIDPSLNLVARFVGCGKGWVQSAGESERRLHQEEGVRKGGMPHVGFELAVERLGFL